VRLVLALIALLVAAQGTGIGLTQLTACHDDCTDDDETGQCPPTCTDCACCSPTPQVMTSTVALIVPFATAHRPFVSDAVELQSIDPHDILHVPKALLA